MEVLSSRILIRASDPERSQRFYGETLGLAVFREFATGPGKGVVYFTGGGFIEVSGTSTTAPSPDIRLWLQVRDVDATHRELVGRGVDIVRPPVDEPWGLREMWIADPDGLRIAIIEVPLSHPLRRRTSD